MTTEPRRTRIDAIVTFGDPTPHDGVPFKVEVVSDIGRQPRGDFAKEESCRCGFIVDEYDDGRYAVEYADPDTGLVLSQCPGCGRALNLRGQGSARERECGWTSPTGTFVCVKLKDHTGNHKTVRVDDSR